MTSSATELDSDGDKLPDEVESIIGNVTPSASQTLVVSKINPKLNFAKHGLSDSIAFSGTLPVHETFVEGESVTVDVGGVVKSFMLSAKGAQKVNNDSFKVKVKRKSGAVVSLPTQKYSAKFSKGNFAPKLLDEGLTNNTVLGEMRTVPVIVFFD